MVAVASAVVAVELGCELKLIIEIATGEYECGLGKKDQDRVQYTARVQYTLICRAESYVTPRVSDYYTCTVSQRILILPRSSPTNSFSPHRSTTVARPLSL